MKYPIKAFFGSLLTLVAILAAVWVLDRSERARFRQQSRTEVLARLSTVRARLEEALNRRVFLVRGLAAYISTVNPDMVNQFSHLIYVDRGCRDEFQRLMEQQGEVTNFNYQVYRKDGSIIWVEEDTRAVRDSSGNLLYYEGLIQDISECKRSEEDLRRQLQELRIEIDQHHRLSEVAVITQSDYFQEIQAEVENIQIDQFWS